MIKYMTLSIYALILIFDFVASDTLNLNSEEATVHKVMEKYFKNVPDAENKYIIDEGLSKTITNFFNGKVNAFPLYKISITMDRTPVKIPWTVETQPKNLPPRRKRYKYVKKGKKIITRD